MPHYTKFPMSDVQAGGTGNVTVITKDGSFKGGVGGGGGKAYELIDEQIAQNSIKFGKGDSDVKINDFSISDAINNGAIGSVEQGSGADLEFDWDGDKEGKDYFEYSDSALGFDFTAKFYKVADLPEDRSFIDNIDLLLGATVKGNLFDEEMTVTITKVGQGGLDAPGEGEAYVYDVLNDGKDVEIAVNAPGFGPLISIVITKEDNSSIGVQGHDVVVPTAGVYFFSVHHEELGYNYMTLLENHPATVVHHIDEKFIPGLSNIDYNDDHQLTNLGMYTDNIVGESEEYNYSGFRSSANDDTAETCVESSANGNYSKVNVRDFCIEICSTSSDESPASPASIYLHSDDGSGESSIVIESDKILVNGEPLSGGSKLYEHRICLHDPSSSTYYVYLLIINKSSSPISTMSDLASELSNATDINNSFFATGWYYSNSTVCSVYSVTYKSQNEITVRSSSASDQFKNYTIANSVITDTIKEL